MTHESPADGIGSGKTDAPPQVVTKRLEELVDRPAALDGNRTTLTKYSMGPDNNNTGCHLVTIDGDNTLADLLPTAQTLVDTAVLPDTVLVANGGTLAPTDRVYNGEDINPTFFSRTLAAGVHTVRITRTGYKIAGASQANIAFCGFCIYGPGLYGVDQTYRHWDTYQAQVSVDAADEISWFFTPAGAGAGDWLGHVGMAVIKTLPVITVDGVDKSSDLLVTNTLFTGNTIVITTNNNIRHPETGATDLGILDIVYTMSKSGLEIYHKTSWGVNGVAYGFPAMLTFDNPVFDRCENLEGTGVALTKSGNNVANTPQGYLWVFDTDGYQAKLMYIPDLLLTVNNWAETDANHKLYCWDQNSTWGKAYVQRIQSGAPLAFTNATVWESRAIYRTAWLPGGTADLIK